MMTREEAVERLKRLKRSCRDLAASMPEEPGWALHGMALDMAISAIRPVSREQVENDLPLQYYPAYRKALRDLKNAIEQVGDNFKHYGMNHWKGMVAVIDIVLQDPERLMYSASLTGYDIPEPYLTKWRKWQQKQREKLEALKDGKGD